jgi:hypothetical protein
MLIVLAVIGIILLGIFIRLAAGSFDKARIQQYIQASGGELLKCRWAPLGPGWFGEKDSRLYAIVYQACDGVMHEAHVKTSVLSGVYLTNDRIMGDPQPDGGSESVEEEKARLRRRLAELEARDP